MSQTELIQKEGAFVNGNLLEIINIIGNKCRACGKVAEHIHHVSYENLPHDNLIEYCRYLVPLCLKHHGREHSKRFDKFYKHPVVHRKQRLRVGDLNRIIQKSVGIKKYQLDWLYDNTEFNFSKFVRHVLDEQIKFIFPEFNDFYIETTGTEILKEGEERVKLFAPQFLEEK